VCLTGLVSTQPFKTLIMALMGLALSTVGMDTITGVYRFTFNSVGLSDGIAFTTLVIGLFSVSEILLMLERTTIGQVALKQGKRSLFNLKEFFFSLVAIIRSSVIGFFLGILPGAGATVASAMAYTTERKMAKDSSKFGK
ncbi:tripartite tricarboxylate transporter permease, partial [Acinetobacter sp. 11520]|nr:tripartite tricarboxylate transporter permease [Acinetobacter sp. 11520]